MAELTGLGHGAAVLPDPTPPESPRTATARALRGRSRLRRTKPFVADDVGIAQAVWDMHDTLLAEQEMSRALEAIVSELQA